MSGFSITLSFSPELGGLVPRLRADMDEVLTHGITVLALRLEELIKEEVPVRTGDLRDSTTSEVAGLTALVKVRMHYAPHVALGTGLWGPKKARIKPKTAGALFWAGANHPVKSIKGMRPNPFPRRALRRLRPVGTFTKAIEAELTRRGW